MASFFRLATEGSLRARASSPETDRDQAGALRSDQLAAATLFLAPLRGSG
jgi:hypothetical protein